MIARETLPQLKCSSDINISKVPFCHLGSDARSVVRNYPINRSQCLKQSGVRRAVVVSLIATLLLFSCSGIHFIGFRRGFDVFRYKKF